MSAMTSGEHDTGGGAAGSGGSSGLIDVHVHLLHPAVKQLGGADLEREPPKLQLMCRDPGIREQVLGRATTERLLDSMAAAGIERSLVFGFPWRSSELCRRDNDYVAEAMARYPDRLSALAVCQPTQPATALQEVARRLDEGFAGVKLKPQWQGYQLGTDGLLDEIAALVRERQAVILVHVSQPFHAPQGDHPSDLLAFLDRTPGLAVIGAHLAGLLVMYHGHEPLRPRLAGLYADTSLPLTPQLVSAAAGCFPAERLLFGSDWPFHPQAPALAGLRQLGLPPVALAGIVGANARKLLRIGGGRGRS